MRPELPSLSQEWLDNLAHRGRQSSTIAAYRASITHFRDWYIAAYHDVFHPAQVMPRHVRDWLAYQQQVECAAPATINRRLVALTQFFQWMMRAHRLLDDPTADVSAIRLGPPKLRSLEPTAVRRLLRAAKVHPRDSAIIEVLLGTGIRVGELLRLRVGDVTLGDRSGHLIVRAGKQDSYREIPLSADVRQALRAYLQRSYPNAVNPMAALWIGAAGPLTQRSSVLRLLSKYAVQIGLPQISPHILRNTFATRYLAANLDDIRGLARLLGHTRLDTVMLYTTPSLADHCHGMECVDNQHLPEESDGSVIGVPMPNLVAGYQSTDLAAPDP
ncbi:MAG: site-specific tyrosine recombinase XerD [Herpetosiphon sp.]